MIKDGERKRDKDGAARGSEGKRLELADRLGNEKWSTKACGGALKVTGFSEDVLCQFIIDTGADVTIISSRLYEQLIYTGEMEKMAIKGTLKGLDWQKITVIGQTMLETTLGQNGVEATSVDHVYARRLHFRGRFFEERSLRYRLSSTSTSHWGYIGSDAFE